MKVDMLAMMNNNMGTKAAVAKEAAEGDSFAEALKRAAANQDDKELRKAAQEFESYFLHQMLKQMRSTVPKSDFLPKSYAQGIYEDMLDQEYGKLMSKAGGIGLADLIVEDFKRK